MTIRLTAAQATVRYLANQLVELDGETVPFFAGAWAIFGHGNVAGLGEALYAARDRITTFRAHNEQAMAHAAIAYAKTMRRRRAMMCMTSIGPGATNMVTAAALAHADRLPVLLLPGDVFATRRPDPVLQQIEDFGDGTLSANDCFRPVSRYFDRISRPEHILTALPRAMATLTSPEHCGPVTLAFCQDVQAEAYDYPEEFLAPRHLRFQRPPADEGDIAAAAAMIARAEKPLLIAGGGVHYSGAQEELAKFVAGRAIPVCETFAGKSALPWNHPNNLGAVGVTGTVAANAAAAEADIVIALGTRLQDFTTGSRALFSREDVKFIAVNTAEFDGHKHGALPVIGDATCVLGALEPHLADYRAPAEWIAANEARRIAWQKTVDKVTAPARQGLPSDAQVIGAVNRGAGADSIVVCAAGGLPGELHKLWRAARPGGFHLEYGYSCMGYEIAGGLGVKMAAPEREVYVMVGDGSYLMLNSEIATSVMLGIKIIIVLLDNRGFGCINRLQNETGNASFNNLLQGTEHACLPEVDFVAHAASLGAEARKVGTIAELEAALDDARTAPRTSVIVIDTDPYKATQEGGFWWDVPVPEVSGSEDVRRARKLYDAWQKRQRLV